MIEVRNLSKAYGVYKAVDDISFSIQEGEIVGFLGPNGAGKTTTIRILTCFMPATSGSASVAGFDVLTQSMDVRRCVGYLPESVPLYPEMRVREYLNFRGKLHGLSPGERAAAITRVADRCWLGEVIDRPIGHLSKGYRQRVGLADALLHNPKILILDEPTVGLDPIATQELYLLIDRLRQGGTSVILCSHVLPGVESHINRAAILAKGRLQAVGSLAQLRAEAGLPVRIRASGIGSSEHWRQRWSDAGHSARTLSETSIEVVAVNGHKLVLLRELLGEGEPEDIEIHQPSLEDLYRYYMERAGDVRTQEVRA